MFEKEIEKITRVITSYFEGLYQGDTKKLRNSFHSEAFLYGDIKGAEYLNPLEDYLAGVASRKSPEELEEKNNMEILSIEILGQVAVAKLHVPMLGYNYYDFLSLSIVEGKWKIVNKLFTHVE